MTKAIQLDAKNLASQTTLEVRIARLNQFYLRLWLAKKLLELASWLSWVTVKTTEQHPLEAQIESLGERGIVISICYGVMRGKGLRWSVQCLNDKTREEFTRPFVANSMGHCIEIAYTESKKRGWLKE